MTNLYTSMPAPHKNRDAAKRNLLRVPALMVLMILLNAANGWSQVAGDYRSKATGNFDVAGTWETYDGSAWVDATVKPGAANTIYIQSSHTVTLTGNESCNDLHLCCTNSINTNTLPGFLKIQNFVLSLNGKLRSYAGAIGTIPGTSDVLSTDFLYGTAKWPLQITSGGTGAVKVVGNTRALTLSGEWGAGGGTAAGYVANIEIALNAGQTVTLGTNIKFANWTLTSGTLDASTFSISADIGSYKNITINSGATFKSSSTGNIVQRTSSTPMNIFTLNSGGTLILSGLGATTKIQAATIVFNGTVEYNAGGGQTLLTASAAGAANPNTYTNLVLSGTGAKTLGLNTTVSCLSLLTPATLALGGFTLTDASGSDITSFNFNGISPAATGSVDAVNHTVALVVPSGTDKTTLVPTIALSCGATVTPASGVSTDFTNPVVYTVTPGYNLAQAWTVSVAYGLSPAKDILATTIGVLNAAPKTITAIPNGTTAEQLLAGLTLSPLATAEVLASTEGSVVAGSTSIAIGMVVKVIAEDLSSQEYTLPKSTDATLASLTLSAGTLDKTYVSATLSYQGLLRAETTTATVSAVKNDPLSTMVIVQATDVTSTNAADRTATITVTAEDLITIKVYSVVFSVENFLLFEPFSLPAGNLVGNGGWSQLGSTATPPIQINSTGLDYIGGYYSSTGNGSASIGPTGQDVNKTFPVQTDEVYAALLVNISSGAVAEDYFFTLTEGSNSTNYKAKIFVKDDPSNPGTKFLFGFTKTTTGASIVYDATPRSYNTTYLLAVKYKFLPTNTTDDITSFWVNPPIQALEPTPSLTSTAGNDINSNTPTNGVGAVALRQGTTTPNLKIDAIKVAKTWANLFGFNSEWTGTSGTDWGTATNWNPNGVPTAVLDTYIPNVTNKPVVNQDAASPAVCFNLKIDAGSSVTVNSGKALTVNGTLNNFGGNSGLVVNSGGSLITNGTVAGDVTVERDITAGADAWHLFISPITTSVTASASSAFNGAYLDKYVESDGAWSRLVTDEAVLPLTGYSINYPSGTHTLSFTGALQPTPVIFTDMSYTNPTTTPGYESGYQLVGNPYPSGINPALCSLTGGLNAFAYVWNGVNYNTYSIGTNGIPGTIASLQGFFVRTSSSTNTFTLDAVAKTHGGSFLKDGAVTQNKLKLSVNGNGYSDETFVRFNESATSGFDQALDAYKLAGIDMAPQLYSILPAEKAAVNTLPSYTTNELVPLGLKVGAATSYTLTAEGMDSFDPSVPIRLDDLKLGTSMDLRLNPVYSFTSAPGDTENRFRLRFASATGVDEQSALGLHTWTTNGEIHIILDAPSTGNVYLYNASGQLVVSASLSSGETLLPIHASGIYLVKVVTGRITTAKKVVVTQL